jgi:group I intron endonuclease
MRKEKKYHYIYKTTNLKNGKFYIGMHSTDNLKDSYLGSGTILRRSIRRNGIENFKIEYLEFFDNRIDLANREKKLVNEELLKDPMCINLVFGGSGGYISPDGYKKGAKRMNEVLWSNPEWVDKKRKLSKEYATNNPKGFAVTKVGGGKYWIGKHHSNESKIKIGEANSIHQKGESNSQFGTCWITNGTDNKKIRKTDLHLYSDWRLGRII